MNATLDDLLNEQKLTNQLLIQMLGEAHKEFITKIAPELKTKNEQAQALVQQELIK